MTDSLTFAQQNMLHLLKSAIWADRNPENQERFSFSEEEWKKIFGELKSQACPGLISGLADRLDLPENASAAFYCVSAKILKKFHTVMSAQEQLLQLLNENGIHAAILKGGASALYYPSPEQRQMGDIDVIAAPEDFDRACQLIKDHGYPVAHKGKSTVRHVSFFAENRTVIEIHRFFSSGTDREKKEYLDKLIFEGVRKAEMRDVAGYRVPVLPALQNGLVLLSHIRQHMGSGLGMRQIIDWMMYVSRQLDTAFWNESFCACAERIGMRKLAETVTLMCKKYLGLQGADWCSNAEDDLADELMEYILTKGNFGHRPDYSSTVTVTVMHHFKNPISALKYLAKQGKVHWKPASEHKILVPIGCLYQLGRILHIGLKRKADAGTYLKEYKQSQREAKMLQRLEIKIG